MKIKLPSGHTFQVDPEDWELLKGHRWFVMRHNRNFYVRTVLHVPVPGQSRRNVNILMHRVILGCTSMGGLAMRPEAHVDHIDGDGLDNRRANLRLVTRSQNHQNQVRVKPNKVGISRYKGVCWDRWRGKWAASICFGRRKVFLGRHMLEEDAAAAYDRAALAAWGEYAHTNFNP